MDMKQSMLILGGLYCSTVLGQQDTVSSDTLKLREMEIVVYQAGRYTPVTYQNILPEHLKLKNYGQEPSVLLSETPSITFYSDAGSTQGYSYYRMRGIDQTRVNVSLDGMPLNEPEDQGAYFVNQPDLLNSISRIQVQRGVGTTKNGVASYAGSIQLYSPTLMDSTYVTTGAEFGSFNTYRIFAEYNSGVRARKGIYMRATQMGSDGYRYRTANDSRSFFLSAGHFGSKAIWKVNALAGGHSNELGWLGVSDSLIAIDPRTNVNSNENDSFFQGMLQLQNLYHLFDRVDLNSSVYYSHLDGGYDFDLNNFLGIGGTGDLYNYALLSNWLGGFSNVSYTTDKVKWTSGIHLSSYERRHTGSQSSVGELYVNTGRKLERSLFTKVEYGIGRLLLFGDLQGRSAQFLYNGSVTMEPLEWVFINPKAGASFAMGERSIFYYSIGKTGREPTRTDMFAGNDDLMADSLGAPVLANTEAEFVVDHEAGIRFLSKRLHADMNLYFMDFDNEIILQGNFGPNGLVLTDNVEISVRYGVELQLVFKLNDAFVLVNNSSYNHSRIREQGESFSPILAPPVIVNQEVRYTRRKFTLSMTVRYQDGAFIDLSNTLKVDPYVLINGSLRYHPKRLEAAVFVNNLTSVRYINHGYVDFDGVGRYFVQAPLNVMGSISYIF